MSSNAMLWEKEFNASYQIPDAVIQMVRDGVLVDNSYHHDTCPSFDYYYNEVGTDYVRLSVEHPDPQKREYDEPSYRFVIGHFYPDGRWDDLLATNDTEEAVQYMRRLAEGADRRTQE
jgi:hypothetical protein